VAERPHPAERQNAGLTRDRVPAAAYDRSTDPGPVKGKGRGGYSMRGGEEPPYNPQEQEISAAEWAKWSERRETAARPQRAERVDQAQWSEHWDERDKWDYRAPRSYREHQSESFREPPNGREYRDYRMDKGKEYHDYSAKQDYSTKQDYGTKQRARDYPAAERWESSGRWREYESGPYDREEQDYNRRGYGMESGLHRDDAAWVDETFGEVPQSRAVASDTPAVQKLDGEDGTPIVTKLMREVRTSSLPMIESYRQALTVCARMGESAAAEEVFGCLVADGIEPDLYCYKAVIAANQRRHNWEGVLRFCDKMHEANQFADAVTYTAILTSLYKGGQFQLVLDRFAEFKSLGCTLDVYSYNVAISTCAKQSNLQLALKCWDELKAMNVEPIVTLYDGIIITSVNCGSVDVAHRLLKEMEENGFELTQQLRVAKTYVLAKQGVVTAAVESLETQAAQSDTFGVGVVRAVLSAIRKSGRVDVLPRVIRLMRVCSLEPDEDCYMQIITSYIMAARVDEASLVVLRMLNDPQGFVVPIKVLEAIVKAAIETSNPKPALGVLRVYEKSENPATFLDPAFLAQLLDVMLAVDQLQEEVSAFVEEQCKKKGLSSQQMCCTLLPQAEAGNCWRCAQFLLAKIESEGCELNAASYEVAIRICERSGEEALAQQLRVELRSLAS
jgi:pentatricopeptide repeat protein